MGTVRTLFIGQGPSGLAEDRVVNAFYWHEPTAVVNGLDINACIDATAAFYNAVSEGQSKTIGEYLSPWVSRNVEYRGYDMADAKPRNPVIVPSVIAGGTGTNGLPEEVACCVTLHALPPNTARRRGRIYIGPLAGNASTGATTSDAARPTTTFISDLCIAARALAMTTMTSLNWSIRSVTPTENYVAIASGYVDNAFDTIIKRGPDATFRLPWTTLP